MTAAPAMPGAAVFIASSESHTTMLGKFFGKRSNQARDEMRKVENRDLMQATIAGAVLVAFADGSCSDQEIDALRKIISSQPALTMFGAEIEQTLDRYITAMKASKHGGRLQLLRELDDVKGDTKEIEDVFAVMMTIAEADGTVEETEKKVLVEVGRRIGADLTPYGLAA